MGLFDIFTNPQQAVSDAAQNVASNVTSAGGNFFTNLISTPFKAIGGFAHGVFGSLWNGVKYTVIIEGLKKFFPQVWYGAAKVIQGPEGAARSAAHLHDDGLPGEVFDSAKEGFGVAAALGGIGGAVDGAGGGLVGTAVVLAFLGGTAAVTIGALHKNGVIASDSTTPPTPSTPPGSRPQPEAGKV